MKTLWIKKLVLATFGMLVMVYSFAIEPQVRVASSNKFILKLDNLIENTNLVIKEVGGAVVYSEVIEKSAGNYNKIFDLSKFADGNYVIEFEVSIQITSFEFSIVNGKFTSSDMRKSVVFKPILTERNKRIYLSKYNPENSLLNVYIYNNKNELVFQETLGGKEDLGRIYDFSKVQGKFTISMINENNRYTKTVLINE
jgi:hypothetical protein